MTDLSGINQFGSITSQNGIKLNFDDFDVNGDGQISADEFKTVMELTNQSDSVELSETISEEEKTLTDSKLRDYRAEAQVNIILNQMFAQILKDFTGSKFIHFNEVRDALKDFAKTFISEYTGEDLIADFKAVLPGKYEELKTEILVDASSNVKSAALDRVLNDVYRRLGSSDKTLNDDTLKSIINSLGNRLEGIADRFISSYNGSNLWFDLTIHLNESLGQSDLQNMASSIGKYRFKYNSLGLYVDSGELNKLKDSVKEFFNTALDKGITLNLHGINIASETAIDKLLLLYTDAAQLNEDMEKMIAEISSKSLLQTVIEEKKSEQQEQVNNMFQGLTGEDVMVDVSPAGIDYSQIPGYYENATIKSRKRGNKGLNGAKDEAKNLLETTLKEQLKTQLSVRLEAKGIPFERIETVFETAFNEASANAVSACVMPRSRFFFGLSKSSYNVQDLVSTFTTQFNKIISTTVDEMNASNLDMDIQDIDYTKAITDDNGNVNPLLQDALETGATLVDSVPRRKAEQYKDLAQEMTNKLKSTMLAKSMAMCEANGIEFNNEAFGNVFDYAQNMAILSSTSEKNQWLGLRKKLSFNPQNCLEMFTETFKNGFTDWVNSQLNGLQNNPEEETTFGYSM